jgi:hypothetical protein
MCLIISNGSRWNIGMNFLARKKADLNLEKSQLRLFSGTERSNGLKVRENGRLRERPVTEPLLSFKTKWGMQSRRTSRDSQESRGKVLSGK